MLTFELYRLVSYDDKSLLAELRRVAGLVHSPYLSASAFDKYSKAHSSRIGRRFGGWQQALERADLPAASAAPARVWAGFVLSGAGR
jgi:hypothetical protein